MKPTILRSAILSAALLAVVPGLAAAQATFTYEWNRSGVFLPNNASISVVTGTTFSLDVYLRETSNTNILSTDKLFSAGVRTTYSNPANIVNVPNTTSIVRNPLFNDAGSFTPTINNPNFAQFTAAVVDPNTDLVGSDLSKRILLGTFTFATPGAANTSTTIQALDIPGSDDMITGIGTSIDLQITPTSLIINVTPVPEPASVLVIAGAGMLAWRILRRS
jgi:hypothetical protein